MSNASSAPELATLEESLYLLLREHRRCILLLDRFGRDPLQEDLAGLPVRAAAIPVNDPLFTEQPDQAPLLVELLYDEPSHHLLLRRSIALALQQSADISGLYGVCGWLVSSAPLTRLESQIRRRLSLRYPDGSHVYLRLFDPRVLPRMLQLLVPGKPLPAGLLGDIQMWCHLGRDGQLIRHCFDGPATPDDIAKAWQIDSERAAAIDRIEALNLSVRKLTQAGTIPRHEDDPRIDAALQTAMKMGLEDLEDQVAYAWRAVFFAQAFTAHPGLDGLIRTAIEDGIPLEVMLQQYFDESNAVVNR